MGMVLNPNEKIDSWDVVATTTEGRKLTLNDLRIDQLPPIVTHSINDWIEANYPVTWINEVHNDFFS